ncbi:MAG: ribosomal protein S18-alanine N-acetyltransferase [Pseudomonadota bacterium]
MNTTIREAASSDIDALAELDASVNPDPWPAGRFRRLIAGSAGQLHAGVLALSYRDRLCGFSAYQIVVDEGTLLNIGVERRYRRRGLARRLLQASLQAMRDHGARHCFLEVRCSNTAALALYRAEGFALDGVREGYYRRFSDPAQAGREDALLMSLPLEALS